MSLLKRTEDSQKNEPLIEHNRLQNANSYKQKTGIQR
jgi:hypothetical protein